MTKIFVSVGMTGRNTEEVRADIAKANLLIRQRFKGDDVEVVDNYDCQKPENGGRLWYLGEAIKKLGDCEYCYFVTGWQNYKGCIVEREICDLYGIVKIEES